MKTKQAELLAMFVHRNQLRQDGEPYINHCERVAHQISLSESTTEDMICAAWLHDTIEDAEYPGVIINIIEHCFEGRVCKLVNTLTHKYKQSYNEYITQVAEDPEALRIKFIDMIDNTSYHVPEKQWLKYRRACLLLREKGVEIPSILKERLKL